MFEGYVFYEADCFGQLRNPYIPVTAEDATLSQLRQKLLSGPGLEERREVVTAMREVSINVLMYSSDGTYLMMMLMIMIIRYLLA